MIEPKVIRVDVMRLGWLRYEVHVHKVWQEDTEFHKTGEGYVYKTAPFFRRRTAVKHAKQLAGIVPEGVLVRSFVPAVATIERNPELTVLL